MTVDFFEKELGRVQAGFNRTFGVMPLCNPRVRVRVVFAIVKLGILQRNIKKENRKEDISRFVKTKDKLSKIFSTLIKESERKQHDNKIKNRNSQINDSDNGGHGDMQLPEVRNRLSNQISKTG